MEQEKFPVHIRDASISEREAIRSVTLAAYKQYETIASPPLWALLQQAILSGLAEEGPVERIVAEYAGKIVGSVQLYPPSMRAYHYDAPVEATGPEVRLLAVDLSLQGHGIGKALMLECIKRAQDRGYSTVGLHTGDMMLAANKMYKRMGFVHVPALDFHAEDESIVKGYRLELEKISLKYRGEW
ncbi:GNAT family N-acetyltransferase [Ktedonosporobacter rubrisoli]|uniref:GNAT family N-acetyltransferase n=1 Tax=Ktedonosporobacter rubrisoli TaxID=2509675 RepID=UPI0013EE43BD|nr:GNAT family N-acetyltransferase [Ktedonosporobacter rubrisoli]